MTASAATGTTVSRWHDEDAAACQSPLAERVYTSRLLGADPSLVLHGGGNTSVKGRWTDLYGAEIDVLWVKGSGRDLATIGPDDFAPLRLDAVRRLAQLGSLSDREMMAQLHLASLRLDAPAASVEAILHALVPARFVDHTHPDALLSVMNTPGGIDRITAIYGRRVVAIPYVMPGFALAQAVADALPHIGPDTIGLVLLNHGAVTFGDTARESYERMIDLVAAAETYLLERGAWHLPARWPVDPQPPATLAGLRRDLSLVAGRPLVAHAAGWHADLGEVSQRGPATPDHVIVTKRIPLLGRDTHRYAEAYRAYFDEYASRRDPRPTMLDPAPRVVIDSEVGLVALGADARGARAACEIYEHTVDVIARAEMLERWAPLEPADVFDVEYWELEQAKLGRRDPGKPFLGEIAVVTGAASGIGRACVERFLELGAAVAGLDLDPAVACVADGDAFLGLVCDVAQPSSTADAVARAVAEFGGLDMLVINAGIFPASAPIAELDLDTWRRTMAVNADGNVALLRAAAPILRLSPRGGRVVVNASKNVPAPGPGAAAYSASKAALTQLARVAALEWAHDGIRVNVVHPNGVFDTGLWTDDVLERRAAAYGLSVDAYRTNNLLGVEVRSRDVAGVITTLCDTVFSRTTGCQIPVDGGNERVV